MAWRSRQDTKTANKINAVSRPTLQHSPIENVGENLRLSNLKTADAAKKNPDALAGGVEVQTAKEAGQLRRNYTPKGGRVAIVKAARALAKCLVSGITGDKAAGLVAIFSARLTEDQKAGIAYAALRSMANENAAYEVASLALFGTYRGEAVA
ncbi:hypothetical protein [Tropicibacter alexandrii]|uniref:hypothetical protein n=1 Tax=Tropicibacter alexandrii TaxID=2267683 RepID=UPI001008D0DE|nr:hypothetical protein [Tropicibacter alexandrii]